METWIRHHMERGTLPERFRGMSELEIYDALGCSVRYAASAGIERYELRDDMVRIEERYPDHTVVRVRTPLGEVRTVYRDIWEDGRLINRRIVEFPVKTVDDLKVVTDLVDRQRFRAERAVGHRAEPTVFLSSSGFTELIKTWCGLPGTYCFTTILRRSRPTSRPATAGTIVR